MTAFPKHVPVRDDAYKLFVRTCPCAVAYTGKCFGDNVPHHVGEDGGRGLKPSDTDLVAICVQHHNDVHACSGPFRLFGEKDIGKELRHVWERHHAARMVAAYERATGRTPGAGS